MFAKYLVLIVLLIHTCQAVTNGNEAAAHQYPYHVAIYLKYPLFDEKLICDGVILTTSLILTSAQCTPTLFAVLYVKAGKHKLTVVEQGQQVRSVKFGVKHNKYVAPGWFRRIAENDIALLKLSEPLTFDEYVQPITLPKSGKDHIGVGTVTGWSRKTRSLQTAQQPFISTDQCKKGIGSVPLQNNINKNQICITVDESACSNDLGGPVIQHRADESPELVGILSWADSQCGQRGYPTGYTRVSSYVDWIVNSLNTL